MLLADTPDGRRVHVWHPDLVFDGIDVAGAKHNHRHTLRSTLLHGSLLHTRLLARPTPYGDHTLFVVGQGSERNQRTLEPTITVEVRHLPDETVCAGSSYVVAKEEYHWARPNGELTITLVEMFDRDPDYRPHVLCPLGLTPVHAFHTAAHSAEQQKILAEAYDRLRARATVQWKTTRPEDARGGGQTPTG